VGPVEVGILRLPPRPALREIQLPPSPAAFPLRQNLVNLKKKKKPAEKKEEVPPFDWKAFLTNAGIRLS